jgi:uncharacterized protein (TIGR02996 family)
VPTFQALLQAVLDEPDADVPRQVLGDYLLDSADANDQARGEFLHVQCRLARAGEGDPERTELEAREALLLPLAPQRWARPFRRHGAKAWSFERGLVGGLTLRAEQFDRVAELIVREQPVRRLRLLGGGWVERVQKWEGLERVRALHLDDGDRNTAAPLLRSPRLAGLRELSIGGRPVADAMRSASCLKSLESLDLTPCDLYSQSGLLRDVRLPRLRSLGCRWVENLGALSPQLRELSLLRAHLNPFVALARTVTLESLTLDGCFSHPTPCLSDLLGLLSLSGLRRFELRDMPLTDAQPLAALLGRGQMTRLVLHNAAGTHLRPLAESGHLGRLRELAATWSVSGQSLPRQHVAALAGTDMPSLVSLSLSGYALTANDLLDLFGAPWLTQLHTLRLARCGVSPHLVSVILKADWPRLAVLDLRGNKLGRDNEALLRDRFGVRVRYT